MTELFAERFTRYADGSHVDLATGCRVRLQVMPHLTRDEHNAWVESCSQRLRTLRRNGVRLIDYGVAGTGRFEALARTLPHENCEHSRDAAAAIRVVASQIVEILETGRPGQFRQIHLRCTTGVMLASTIEAVARAARLHGFTPACITALTRWPSLMRALASRHVLLVDDGGRQKMGTENRRELAEAAIAIGLANSQCHVALIAHTDDACELPFVESDGKAWPTDARADRACRVAESAAACDAAAATATVALCPPPLSVMSPGSDDLSEADGKPVDKSTARARERASAGASLAARGLHAAGERTLREAMSMLSRRNDRSRAAACAISLGRLLVDRGRCDEAIQAFEHARILSTTAGATYMAIKAAVWIGLARTDAGQLLDAEAALRAAGLAAEQVGDGDLVRFSVLALARSLFWQGRYDEVTSLVGGCEGWSTSDQSVARRLAARAALARRDLAAACRHAALAVKLSEAAGDPAARCCARAVAAAVYTVLGDTECLRQHVAEGLQAAAAAHAPLLALRLRLTLVEGLSASGRAAAARSVASRIARLRLERIPALLRARAQLALAGTAPPGFNAREGMSAATLFIRASGAKALELPARKEPVVEVISHVADVLHVCHESESDVGALEKVCDVVREKQHAATVAMIAADPQIGILTSCGRPFAQRSSMAQRVAESGLSFAPTLSDNGIESAAPVRYGGVTIAVLVSRWPVDVRPDSEPACALLAAAAAASAPSVRALLDKRSNDARLSAPTDLDLHGVSSTIESVRQAIRRSAPAPFAVLIEGESGVGKELVARAIHRCSPRRARRFCAVNCAALADELLEAELFGHARGAFTGAVAERAGLFEEADGGTLFLDEIGELSGRGQAKLLRVIQDGEVRRVGESFTRHVDVRIVAATNRQLECEAASGRFRRDLLYRLDVVRIRVPPLRERVEDIPILACHFWTAAASGTGSRATLDPDTLAALARYDWPGNVRELQNVMAALAVEAPRRGRIGPSLLPEVVVRAATSVEVGTLEEARRLFETRYVKATLARTAGHRGRAAVALGLSRQGFAKMLRRLKVEC